jgi:ubiquinone/menaquinone biosynthesis C-methylase UbiE
VPTGNAYDKLGSQHPLERRFVAGFMRALMARLPDATPSTILEVGVGEGIVANKVRPRYPDSRFFGVDLEDEELANQWRRDGLAGIHADATALPFRANSCDLVLAIEVLEHVPDARAALAEIARVACGRVILSVPHEPWWRMGNLLRRRYVKDLGNTPGHLQHWTRRGFARFVSSELDVEDILTPFPWVMVVARSRPR